MSFSKRLKIVRNLCDFWEISNKGGKIKRNSPAPGASGVNLVLYRSNIFHSCN